MTDNGTKEKKVRNRQEMKTTVTEGEISLDGRILVKQKALAPFRTC
jgi:hypothetical protein